MYSPSTLKPGYMQIEMHVEAVAMADSFSWDACQIFHCFQFKKNSVLNRERVPYGKKN